MISAIQPPIKPKIPPLAPTVMYSGKKMALRIVPPGTLKYKMRLMRLAIQTVQSQGERERLTNGRYYKLHNSRKEAMDLFNSLANEPQLQSKQKMRMRHKIYGT